MRLHVRAHGTGLAGVPFLLVHGLSSNARLWDGVIDVPVLAIPAGSKTPDLAGLRDVKVRPYPGGDHDLHAQHPASIAADLLSLA